MGFNSKRNITKDNIHGYASINSNAQSLQKDLENLNFKF